MTSEVEHYMEKCRTLSARLVEVEQALRALLDAPKRPGAAQRRWERDGNTADADLLSEWQKAHDEIVAHARAVLDKGEPECAAAGCENAPVTQFADGAGRVLWLCEGHGDLLAVGFPLRSVARPVLDCWPVLDKGEPTAVRTEIVMADDGEPMIRVLDNGAAGHRRRHR